jgi:signal transduction histidine kinase
MVGNFRILCIEDQAEDFEIAERQLKKSGLMFSARRVDTKEEYLEALADFSPDVILSDHSLPRFNSMEALKICQAQDRVIPFILLTGTVSEQFAVDCMKQGAEDYVLKSQMSRLPNAVKNALKHRDLQIAKQQASIQLAEQYEIIAKVNRELDSFVYSVSHNLRAPLASVLGLLNLARREDVSSIVREYHEMMARNISKLDDTLQEILDYSRNSRQDLNIERVDLRQIIYDTLEKLKYSPGAESINVQITVKRSTLLYTDRYRLSMILNNLISNAIKYRDVSKKSFLRISGSIEANHAEIVMADNGIGISEEFLASIFSMFFRATEQSQGSGLGLYITKEAVDRLGGTIKVQSTLGKGTSFTIHLPNRLL